VAVITSKLITLSDGVDFEIRYHDVLPGLTPEQYDELREDIRKNGILIPILVDQWNVVIDGQHRLKIAKELGIPSTDVPQQLTLNEDGAPQVDVFRLQKQMAIGVNLNRRHLEPEVRASLVEILKGDGLSNRAIAEMIGVDESTIRADLKKCSVAGNPAPEHPPTVTGTDGKNYSKSPGADIAERRERVKAAKEEGKSVRAIAEEVGVSVGTVSADLQAPEPVKKPVAIEKIHPAEEPVSVATEKKPKKKPVDNDEPNHPEVVPPSTVNPVTPVPQVDLENFELNVKRQSPDLWHVLDEVSGSVVGIIEKGAPGSLSGNMIAHARIPRDGEPVEVQIKNSCNRYFDTLKSVRSAIEKALGNVDAFWQGEEVYNDRDLSYLDRDSSYHLQKSPKLEKFHDIDLDKKSEGWKQKGLQTSSLWLFGARAKGEGRDGSYHGNCIPQVAEQILTRYTCAGDVFLDCFAGSCTTLVEAQRMGRHWIGIELDAKLEDRYSEVKGLRKGYTVSEMLWNDASAAFVYDHIREYLKRTHKRDDLDHVFLHPPYWDIVPFGSSRESQDLSKVNSLSEFLKRFQLVVWRAVKLLKPGKFFTLVIGDISKGGNWVPLCAYCMSKILELGNVRLMARNIKDIQGNQHGAKQAGLQAYRAVKNGTSTFAFEEVMVFQKVGEKIG